MSFSPGDRVDRYEVVELLGSGGMGEVYRARDPRLARQVALKILRAEVSLATDGRRGLLREARAVATLSHPNVLAVFDAGELTEPEHLRGTAYIAMELVVGSALRAHVGDASVPIERRVGWLQDIARALAAAHEAGIVHRDVKPENVMIRFDGAVKVLDFGIARSIFAADALSSTDGHSLPTLRTAGTPAPFATIEGSATLTGPGEIAGTLYYMAPEQLRGEIVDGRADQFSWGVVAYELLTGVPPWSVSSHPLAIASQILSHALRPPHEIDPRIPRATSNAIMRALSKHPSERFPAMTALLGALAGENEPGAPEEPVSAMYPARNPLGWRFRLALGVSGAVFVAAAGATLFSPVPRGSLLPPASPSAQRGVAPPGAPIVEASGCETNAECTQAHGGAPWRCQSVRHECVAIESPDCHALVGPADLTREDLIWFGELLPTTGDAASDIAAERRALDLARRDFSDALGSSAARPGGLHARPIGLVVCDESRDPLRAARHLADDVEVPAVIGFRWAKSALSTIPSVFLPSHVLSLVSVNQAAELTSIPEAIDEPRLVWRTTLNDEGTARPLGALIEDVLEPQARAEGLGEGTFKVAVVRSVNNGAHDLTSALFRSLRFNGKSALENGESFRQYVFDDASGAGAEATVRALLELSPQVIVYQGASFVRAVLAPLEKRWGGGTRPKYLVNSELGEDVAAFAGADPERRRRFFGATNVSTTLTNAELVLHYNLEYPEEPVTRTGAPQPSYDAFYTLAYASETLGDGPIDGPGLSRAIGRLLPPGPRVEVGPNGILRAFQTLRSGGGIDLEGAIGSLDFDASTGEAPIDYAIVCLGVNDRGRALASVESGLVYEAREKKLRGALRCP